MNLTTVFLGQDPAHVIAVDLDGTLIRTDLLHEGFWAAVARDPSVPLKATVVLAYKGRAGLKVWLAGLAPVDPANLPYTDSVVTAVRRWRQRGGRTVLITAADHQLAGAVAAHLGLFDEVYGTRPGNNLKGSAKARFLEAQFGRGRFLYVGDSVADLKVWPGAAAAVTVGAGRALQARVEGLGIEVEHLPAPTVSATDLVGLVLRGGWIASLAGLITLAALISVTGGVAAGLLALVWLGFGVTGTGAAVMHDLLRLPMLRARMEDPGPVAAGRIAMPLASAFALGFPLVGVVLSGLVGGTLAALSLAVAGLGGILFGPGPQMRPVLAGFLGIARAGLAGLAGLGALSGL